MADVKFLCPKCGQSLEAPPDMAGLIVECPACEEDLQIPPAAWPASAPPTQEPLDDATPVAEPAKPVDDTTTIGIICNRCSYTFHERPADLHENLEAKCPKCGRAYTLTHQLIDDQLRIGLEAIQKMGGPVPETAWPKPRPAEEPPPEPEKSKLQPLPSGTKIEIKFNCPHCGHEVNKDVIEIELGMTTAKCPLCDREVEMPADRQRMAWAALKVLRERS